MTARTDTPARPWLWFGLFTLNIGLIAAARIFDVLEPPATWILLALNMALLIPTARATRRLQEQKGAMSPALRNYNRRFLGFSAVYMVAMIAGGNIANRLVDGSPAMWLIAIVPVVPVLGMIWTIFNYLRKESDEYLRHRAVIGALTGLALVLTAGTVWGFLEMFELVPHIWNWWVFPAWAIGMGIGMCFGNAKGEE